MYGSCVGYSKQGLHCFIESSHASRDKAGGGGGKGGGALRGMTKVGRVGLRIAC